MIERARLPSGSTGKEKYLELLIIFDDVVLETDANEMDFRTKRSQIEF